MKIRRFIALQTILVFIGSLLFSIASISSANAVACDNGVTAQNGIVVTPSQGKAFYIDSGQGQNIDASYVGYRVKSSSARKGIWVKLSNFTGGVVGLANPLDSEYALDAFSGNDTKTAYFLLKAGQSSTTAQGHTVSVYNGRPDVGTLLYSCTYTFSRVTETIKANPNKVSQVTVSTIPSLGGTFTISVLGNTGTIGSGKTPDFDSMWLTPTGFSTFPTQAMRLEKVETLLDNVTNLKLTDTCGAGTACFTDQLLIDKLQNVAVGLGASSQSKLDYWVKYTFRIIGSAPSFQIKPLAQISSGNQMKHTPLNSFTGQAVQNIDLSGVSLTSVTLNKVVNATTSTVLTTTGTGSSTMLLVPYKVTVTNNGSSAITIDKVTDIPDSAVAVDSTYTPTTAFFAATTGGSSTSTGTLATPIKSSNGEVVFSGPMTIAASGRVEISYRMQVPQCPTGSGTQSYTNKAYASIGSTILGSSTAGYMPASSLSTSCSSTTNLSAVPPSTTVQMPIDVITNPATSVLNTSATLNGSVDSNGQTGQAISFEWGTSSALGNTATASTTSTTSSTNPISITANLTGLTAGTLYYFRVRAGSNYGQILTFVTTEPVAAPTVTTDPPTGVSSTNATLNATVDPNQTNVTVEFDIWYLVGGVVTGKVTKTIVDDPTSAYNSSTNPYSELSGAFPVQVSLNMNDTAYGLSGMILANRTIYYQARVIMVAVPNTPTLAAQTQQFMLTTYYPQEITFPVISDITYGDSAPTITSGTSASSGLAVTYSSSTPDVCTVTSTGTVTIVGSGICTIATDQSGGLNNSDSKYYDPANQVVQSFNVNLKAITITAAAKSKFFGDSDPTLTYSITSGALVGSDTLTGTLSRAAGDNVGTYLISQSSVAAPSSYNVTYVSANLTINPKVITVTAAAKTKEFGSADPALTYSSTPVLIGSDTFTGTLSRASGENVNTYSISQNTLALPSNYSITYNSANFTITQKTLTITADNKTKNAGDSTPTFTFSSDGLISPNTLTSVTYNFSSGSYPSSTTVPTADGSYSITPSAAVFGNGSAGNYNIVYVAGTYAITSLLSQHLTWTTIGNKVYGQTAIATVVSNQGLTPVTVTSHTPSICTVPNSSASGATVTLLSVGVCELNAARAGNGSTIGAASDEIETFTVTAAPLAISGAAKSKTYGDSDPALTYTLTSGTLYGSDTLTGTLARTSGLNVGTYTINQGSVSAGSNYTITYTNANLTINPRGLVITASSPTGINAGDPVPTITASYSGFAYSETETVLSTLPSCVTSYTTSSAAGSSQTTSCTGAAGSNYTISYIAGSFNVTGSSTPAPTPTPEPTPPPKQNPTINWSNPGAINEGTPLSGSQLNASFSVSGTCTYSPAIGAVLPAGTYTLSVTCTPSDPSKYNSLSTTVTLIVKKTKKKPTILWFNPNPIVNPTPLSGTQLNASPSVPGKLDYSPSNGTVLDPGTHILNVKLTPDDSNYEELEARVTILVTEKPKNPNSPNSPTTPNNSNNTNNSNNPNKPADTTTTAPAPEAPKTPAKPADPAPIATLPTVPVMQTAGKKDEVVTLKPNEENTGFVLAAADWSLAISSTTKFVQGNTQDTSARVVIEKGNTITTSGTGFKPFSQVDVYVYSTPTWLGAVMTDALGNFTTTLPMPKALAEGDHTFQAQGVTPDDKDRKAAVPITLIPATVTDKPGALRFEVYFAMNSPVVSAAEKARIDKFVNFAKSKIASGAKVTVAINGWVQPNPQPGDITYLSTHRANNVANILRRLGLKGIYDIKYPGLAKDNVPKARHTSVIITWSKSK